ncbi:hypothetical protein [uncultured Tateyamaria sp.]|uniref:hypothetical protein n=1 Tax=uncultured Tateyamaria sp. TaxID=455651 RepID=UPI00261E6CB5|nr:hypothetical protein [uncultured Tateyamaria sp.]
MRDIAERLNDHIRERSTPRPDRSEMAEIWLQVGLPQGLSMEWVFDRYDQGSTYAQRRNR